ncbi:MAG TPA: class I tRNA ligase family protein [Streptosporangiaceae bacterium]|jgi:cysteinyl-tRNA synthetase|nr:class I tRNA ligase family protein [Streptosporangiaceae bacterium]
MQMERRPPGVTLGGTPLQFVGRARVYACGITPYDVTHLGHASTYVWVDVLAKVIEATGAEAIVCRNVTNVDDVLTAAAQQAGEPYDRFAAIGQFYFDGDMSALGVRRPALEPRAHAYVPQVIALAAGLLERGLGYERDGQVYFRGGDLPARAGLDPRHALTLSQEYGDRPDDPARDEPFDVPVWQASKDGEPAWDSPWGRGRPGWHAECAAMALDAFGPSVDVQAGGADLRFPHHAYQAALAEALTGVTPFARAALQCAVVSVDGAKMAKSTGNLVLVKDLLAGYPAAAIRMLILDHQWNADWDYRREDLDRAGARVELLAAAANRPGRGSGDAAQAAIAAALARDLDVPAALAVAEEAGGKPAAELGAFLGLW